MVAQRNAFFTGRRIKLNRQAPCAFCGLFHDAPRQDPVASSAPEPPPQLALPPAQSSVSSSSSTSSSSSSSSSEDEAVFPPVGPDVADDVFGWVHDQYSPEVLCSTLAPEGVTSDCIEHFRFCKVLSRAAHCAGLTRSPDESWHTAYASGKFGRPAFLRASFREDLRRRHTHEFVRWVAAIFDAHNFIRSHPQSRSAAVVTGLLLRSLRTQRPARAKERRRRQARRERRSPRGGGGDSSDGPSSSGDSPLLSPRGIQPETAVALADVDDSRGSGQPGVGELEVVAAPLGGDVPFDAAMEADDESPDGRRS